METFTSPDIKSAGLVYGMALIGTYNSPIFKYNNMEAKARAIAALLDICGSSVDAASLCLGDCNKPGQICLPSTLQSAGNDDADLSLVGPDANDNCYYNLVITGKGVVGWSALKDSCICTQR